MRRFLLDVLYLLIVIVVGPFWLLRRRMRRRPMPPLAARLGWIAPLDLPAPRVWLHGVSVGEVLAARGLVRSLREQGFSVVVTSTTTAGLATAREQFGAACVREAPLDFSCSIARFLKRVRPQALVLLELELWPNMLLACGSRGMPVLLTNARLSERSFRGWSRLLRLVPGLLRPVRVCTTQNEDHARRFVALGMPEQRVRACGNLKFDNVTARDRGAARAERRGLWGISDSTPIVIAGSTHEGEELMLLEAFAALRRGFPELRLILAPRHAERTAGVVRLAERFGRVGLFSRAVECHDADIVVVDALGVLAELYAVADVAVVGGSLVPVGGHNLLEPAAFGVPVITGPHIATVQALAEELAAAGALRIIALPCTAECVNLLNSLLNDPDAVRRATAGAARVIASHSGSLSRTLQALSPELAALHQEPVSHG